MKPHLVLPSPPNPAYCCHFFPLHTGGAAPAERALLAQLAANATHAARTPELGLNSKAEPKVGSQGHSLKAPEDSSQLFCYFCPLPLFAFRTTQAKKTCHALAVGKGPALPFFGNCIFCKILSPNLLFRRGSWKVESPSLLKKEIFLPLSLSLSEAKWKTLFHEPWKQ